MLSPILFLVAIDWTMKQMTADKPRGIQWTPTWQLDILGFSGQPGTPFLQPEPPTWEDRVALSPKQIALNISLMKTQVISIRCPTQAQIKLEGEILQTLETFTYPLWAAWGTMTVGQKRTSRPDFSRACAGFTRSHSIWKSKEITTRTQLKLYNSSGKSVLLYRLIPQDNLWHLLAEQNKQHRAISQGRLSQHCPGGPATSFDMVGPGPKDAC